MPRTTTHTTVAPNGSSGIFSRLRNRNRREAEVTVSEHTNPITGSHTRTKKTKTHPHGLNHHGHGTSRGPLATSTAGTRTTAGTTATTHHHHHRKPSLGDKISGAMTRLRGDVTHRPGVKAAGTRRMRGTDGRGSHRVY